MPSSITIGSAASAAGEIIYGSLPAVELPTGGHDQFPIIIAQGRQDGPTLWITGSIHGNEYSGLAVIHTLLGPGGQDFPLADLRGTVVLVPTLSPAGLRTGQRSPYYNHGADPNRMFPDLDALAAAADEDEDEEEEEDTSTALERAYARLFEAVAEHCDALVDLHNAGIGSIPFSFRDPIYYAEGEADAARALMARLDALLTAFGMPVTNEFPSRQYLKKKLHRSVSGAVLNRLHRPAFTVELGGYDFVDLLARDAAVIGLRNVMRHMDMLPGPLEPLPPIPQPAVDFPVRRLMHPRVPRSGIVTHLVQAGDVVRRGDVVARLTDIYGRPIALPGTSDEGLLRSEHDGYVVGLLRGTVYYENEACIWMAVRDESEMVLPLPSSAP